MTNLTPFQFENQSINIITADNGEPWFSANEICDVLGYGNPRQAIETHVDEEDVQKLDTLTPGGRQMMNHINESGLYALIFGSYKEEAKRFKRWVTHEVLPTLRKTGSYAVQGAQAEVTDAFKLIPAVVRAARAVGMDKNAAALSANQLVAKLTGTNVMLLLGVTHLEAENQGFIYFTPTELGERFGLSGRKFNMLLAEAGLQAKEGEHWVPLPLAEGFCRVLDTGKRHSDGAMVQQIKWACSVLPLLDLTLAA